MLIRAATLADAAGIARVHVDAWGSAYRGLMPDVVIDSRTYEKRLARWARTLQTIDTGVEAVFVAQVDDGQIAGFASGGPVRDAGRGYAGELYTLYVLQAYQGQGIGRGLVRAVAEYLATLGARSMLVWALDGGPANRFYAALGGHVIVRQPFEQDGYTMHQIGYGWDDTSPLIG